MLRDNQQSANAPKAIEAKDPPDARCSSALLAAGWGPGGVDVVTGGEVMVPGGVLPADDDDAVVYPDHVDVRAVQGAEPWAGHHLAGVPAAQRPAATYRTRSKNPAAGGISWVTITMVLPCSRR